jgi:hypothetical protein
VAAHPDVGPAVATAGFLGAAFEGVGVAVDVDIGGGGLVEDAAEVVEPALGLCALGERAALPFGDEFGDVHC